MHKRTGGVENAYQRAIQKYLQKQSKKLAEKYIHKTITKNGQAELKAQAKAASSHKMTASNAVSSSQNGLTDAASDIYEQLSDAQFIHGDDERLFYGPMGKTLGLLVTSPSITRWPGTTDSDDSDDDDNHIEAMPRSTFSRTMSGTDLSRTALRRTGSEGNLATDYLWSGVRVSRAAGTPYDRMASGYLRRICSSGSLCTEKVLSRAPERSS